MSGFVPGPDTTRSFRTALSQFGTGVTVVTVPSPDGPMGITVNSFASVSLDPPLVLWSPSNGSRRASHFINAKKYAIHVLSLEQADVSAGFAEAPHSFDTLTFEENEDGLPLIQGCLARFECKHHAVHDGGDHSILVGEVERVTIGGGRPLLFHAGQFGTFSA